MAEFLLDNGWANVERKGWQNKFILRVKKMFMPDILLALGHIISFNTAPGF